MSSSSNENFLARWSRLKQKPQEQGEHFDESSEGANLVTDGSDPSAAGGAASSSAKTSGRSDATTSNPGEPQSNDEGSSLRDFSDFDFDKLDYDPDYTQFLKDDVPADARKQALRKLWVSNPVLANMDGLDDYCEDYTDAAVVPVSAIKTAYRVGRGFLNDQELASWEELGRPDERESGDGEVANDQVATTQPAQHGGPGEQRDQNGQDQTAPDDEASSQYDISSQNVASDAVTGGETGGAGAACAAVVKREEAEALAEYEAETENDAAEQTDQNLSNDVKKGGGTTKGVTQS